MIKISLITNSNKYSISLHYSLLVICNLSYVVKVYLQVVSNVPDPKYFFNTIKSKEYALNLKLQDLVLLNFLNNSPLPKWHLSMARFEHNCKNSFFHVEQHYSSNLFFPKNSNFLPI